MDLGEDFFSSHEENMRADRGRTCVPHCQTRAVRRIASSGSASILRTITPPSSIPARRRASKPPRRITGDLFSSSFFTASRNAGFDNAEIAALRTNGSVSTRADRSSVNRVSDNRSIFLRLALTVMVWFLIVIPIFSLNELSHAPVAVCRWVAYTNNRKQQTA